MTGPAHALSNDLLENLSQIGVALGGDLKALYFPDTGPFARNLFPKSLEFFEATGTTLYKVLSIFGGNRTSKTFTPCYAISCWVTGEYPDWWDEVGGLRFEKPVRVLVSGATGALVRDSIQEYLIGKKHAEGGLVHPRFIHRIAYQSKPYGLAELAIIDGKYGRSIIEFKSNDMGRVRFQSAAYDVVLLDEEHDAGVFSECVTRTGTTRGLVINAFTALKGVTPLVAMLLPQYVGNDELSEAMRIEAARWHTFIGWDDIPESVLSLEERRRLRSHYAAHELLARTTGVPTIGSGMVWPVGESDISVPAFKVPEDWPQMITLDPGFDHGTGALRFALDQESDQLYITSAYWKRLEHYAVHCDRIAAWGDWIPVVIDYASGQNAEDGEAVKAKYRKKLKNPVVNANKAFSVGAGEVYDRFCNGRLFVFDSCRDWFTQFRQYVRNEKGRIAMPNDPDDAKRHHFELMDCTRYGAMGVGNMRVIPPSARSQKQRFIQADDDEGGGAAQEIDVMRGIFR